MESQGRPDFVRRLEETRGRGNASGRPGPGPGQSPSHWHRDGHGPVTVIMDSKLEIRPLAKVGLIYFTPVDLSATYQHVMTTDNFTQ
jgi:hypothetical protein